MSIIVTGVLAGAGIAAIAVIAPAVKQAMDMAPFLYANTRCSARTGKLLTTANYAELLSSNSYKEFYGLLEDTAYNSIVEHNKDFVSFSKAINENMYSDLEWLKRVVPEKVAPVIKALMLRFEINDIKELLNNIRVGAPEKEFHHISNDELRYKLQGAIDFESVISAVEGTKYEEIFNNSSLEEIEKLNTKLDRYYITHTFWAIKNAPKGSVAAFLDLWRRNIDLFNVRMAYRKLLRGMEELELIDGGLLDIKSLEAVSDMTQFEAILRDSDYGELLGNGISSLDLETAFLKSMKNLSGLLNSRHPLQAGYVVRFIVLKEIEVRNLNTIAKLKEEHYPEEDIKKLIV